MRRAKKRKERVKGLSKQARNKRPRRQRIAFLNRHILAPDDHYFIGRIFDLSIVEMHFESYEDLAQHADCKYAFDVNLQVSSLARRIESLNLAGSLLWPEPWPREFKSFPISRYEWLTVAADVFLMRYISVVDCAMILVNSVFELGLEARQCSIVNLEKRDVPTSIVRILKDMLNDQGDLRSERNARFHHGVERGFTDDDQAFRLSELVEHKLGGFGGGTDSLGRKIDLERSFKEGLVEGQCEFNQVTRRLVRRLNRLYDGLWETFEERFGPRVRNSTHGLRIASSPD